MWSAVYLCVLPQGFSKKDFHSSSFPVVMPCLPRGAVFVCDPVRFLMIPVSLFPLMVAILSVAGMLMAVGFHQKGVPMGAL